MVISQILYLTLLFNILIVSVVTGVYAWHLRKEHPAAPSLAATLLTSSVIFITFLAIDLLRNSDNLFFFVRLRIASMTLAAALFLLFILGFSKHPFLQGRRWLLFIIPLITCVIVAVDRREGGIFFKSWELTYSHSIPIEKRAFTGWFWVHTPYTFACLGVAMVLLARQLRRHDSLYHEQARSILSGMLAGMVVGTLGALPIPSIPQRAYLAPIGIGVAEVAFAWVIFQQRLLNSMPVAYVTLWQNMNDAALVLDDDQTIIEANPSAEKLFKRDRLSMIGQPLKNVGGVALTEAITTSDLPHSTYPLYDRFYDLNFSPMITRNRRYGYLLTLRDITEHKLAEQRTLELTVERERTILLRSFIRDVAHEFRTPLTIIHTNLYLLGKIPDTTRHGSYRQHIQDQAERIMLLVNSLAQMTQLDYATHLPLKPADVNRLAEIVAERWRGPMRNKSVDFKLELDRSLPMLLLAETEFATALHHLLDNALRYSDEGDCVTLQTGRREGQASIEVADTGTGIDPTALPHIFQRLYRSDAAHTSPGFGLGLPITHRIIELHQGTIEVESVPNQGSRFRIVLPLH